MIQINSTTKKEIQNQIIEGIAEAEDIDQIVDRIDTVFVSARKNRSKFIAQTVTTKVAGFATQQAFIQSDVLFKEWLDSSDKDVRDTHRELDRADPIPVEQNFVSSSGATAAFPGDFGVAEEDINCRCSIIAHFPEEQRSMTPDERQALKIEKEEKLISRENILNKVSKEVFDIQEEAIKKRIRAILS